MYNNMYNIIVVVKEGYSALVINENLWYKFR